VHHARREAPEIKWIIFCWPHFDSAITDSSQNPSPKEGCGFNTCRPARPRELQPGLAVILATAKASESSPRVIGQQASNQPPDLSSMQKWRRSKSLIPDQTINYVRRYIRIDDVFKAVIFESSVVFHKDGPNLARWKWPWNAVLIFRSTANIILRCLKEFRIYGTKHAFWLSLSIEQLIAANKMTFAKIE
jgi:hypothetical protein